MRQVGRYLEELLESPGIHLVAHQCEDNRQRERHRDGVQADHQCVCNRVGEHIGVEIPQEVFQPSPRASPDAHCRTEILERNDHAVHRQIGKADKNHDRGKHQQIQSPVSSGPDQYRRSAHGFRPPHVIISPFLVISLSLYLLNEKKKAAIEFIDKPIM